MVRREKAKTAALVLTAVIMSISIICSLNGYAVDNVGISKDTSVIARFAYSFFHASVVHALLNCWCLLSVVFIYNIPLSYIAIAYIIAVTYPVGTLCALLGNGAAPVPTVGLSAVCFALFGMVAFKVKRKLYFHTWVLSFIAVGFILPYLCSLCGLSVATPDNILHIYCYVAGLIVGFLDSPAPWKRK